jgi:acetyl-CoA acetyltransferase family protein
MDAYLIDAVRTPFGKHRGGLSGIRPDDLAALPIEALMRRHGDVGEIDDVILGDTNGAGEDNRDVARMALLLAGLPPTVPGVTVNRLCGSGGEALVQAARAVRTGDAEVVIAGGVESMTRAPFVMPKPDTAFPGEAKLFSTQVGWRMVNPRFPARWTASLGACAEAVAADLGIGRKEQDEWAVRSHTLAAAAWQRGLHDDYIVPIEGVPRDESIRPGTTLDKLAALRSAFSPDGAVTAGNASPINDGALAALVGSQSTVDRLGVEPLGRIVASATVGIEPHLFSIGPVGAVRKVLDRAGLSFSDIAVWEINEAFAAMVLANLHHLPEVKPELVNPHGGAIAIGHPLGASAPRVVVDACRELRRRGGGYAVAAACIGVGQGFAMVVRVG